MAKQSSAIFCNQLLEADGNIAYELSQQCKKLIRNVPFRLKALIAKDGKEDCLAAESNLKGR